MTSCASEQLHHQDPVCRTDSAVPVFTHVSGHQFLSQRIKLYQTPVTQTVLIRINSYLAGVFSWNKKPMLQYCRLCPSTKNEQLNLTGLNHQFAGPRGKMFGNHIFFLCVHLRDRLEKDSSSSHTAAGTGQPTARSRLPAELNKISVYVRQNRMSVC